MQHVQPFQIHSIEDEFGFLRRRVTCIQGETGCGKSSRVPQSARMPQLYPLVSRRLGASSTRGGVVCRYL